MRGLGLTVSLISMNTFCFLSTKMFPILTDAISLYGSISIYGIICAVGTVFVIVFIEETSGINLDTVGEDKKDNVP